jgi:hypothetical protein
MEKEEAVKLNQAAGILIDYPAKAKRDLKKATVLIALYLRQLFTFCFDKKGLGSQDIQEWLFKNSA